MPLLKVTFSDAQLAGIDGLRRGQPRASWVRDRVQDVLVASRALAGDPRAVAAAELVEQRAPAGDPEDGALSPDPPLDDEVRRLTGHPGQPCRCPGCTAERRRLRAARDG